MKRRADLTIGQRLALSFGTAGVLVGLLIGMSHYWTDEIAILRHRQTTIFAPRAAAADRLESAILYQAIAARNYLLMPGAARLQSYEDARLRVDETLRRLSSLPADTDGARLFARIPALVERYEVTTEQMVALATAHRDLHTYEPAKADAREQLLGVVRAYAALQRRKVEQARQATNDAVTDMDRAALSFGALVLALLAVTGWLATQSVRGPAQALVRATRRLGAGDFEPARLLLKETEARVPVRDELAQLEHAFGRMGVDLERLVADLQEKQEKLQAQQEELLAQNQEQQRQNEELQTQREELQAQREELQAQNEELQAQGEELHAQGDELGRTVERLTASEEALRAADRNKNDFLAVLSHELRNPLAPIRNSIYILERAAPGSEQAKRALVVIGRQVSQLAQLVDDLLDVTRISRGKIELRRTGLDLGPLVRDVAEDQRSLFTESGIHLSFEVPAEPVRIEGDSTRLAQVVGNILQNAAKFTPPEGRVTVTLEAVDGKARIRVRDSGAGMEPDTLGRLFQPFMQADVDLARTRGGLGLGLALSKALVQMHGGTIAATSGGRGNGSEFVIELPTGAGVAPTAEPAAPPQAARRRVLVIEDNEDAAASLQEALEIVGHEVEVAHEGATGIDRARARRPDVLLCDIGLPDMDGHEVAKVFRSDPDLRSVFLVAVTGYALPEDRKRATDAGFDEHLSKPMSLRGLEELLSHVPARDHSAPRH